MLYSVQKEATKDTADELLTSNSRVDVAVAVVSSAKPTAARSREAFVLSARCTHGKATRSAPNVKIFLGM